MYQRGTIVLKNIFIINGVPIEMRQKHKVQTNFFLGNIWKCVQGSFGHTLEPVALSSGGGGWSKNEKI